jgi:acetoin utilization protein AcuB
MRTTDTVGHWMTSSPICVSPHDDVQIARRLFTEHGIRHLPVVDGGKLVGLICERDLQVAELFAGKRTMTVDVVMATPYVVTAKTRLREVAAQMSQRREDAAVVVEDDRPLGVFTTADALRAIASSTARVAKGATASKEKHDEAH